MKPDVDKVLEILAGSLLVDVAPAVQPAYKQASLGVTAILLSFLREDNERGAARRVEENAAIRALFRDAAGAVTDSALRKRIEAAGRSADPSLLLSQLEAANQSLRGLLIELHAHVEELPGPAARKVDDAIWRELVTSTERRKLALAPF
jgi:hypothetical protein